MTNNKCSMSEEKKPGRDFSYQVQQHYTKSVNGYIITRDRCTYFMSLTNYIFIFWPSLVSNRSRRFQM